jgi:ACS family sodium-dependent inorganic phosphate cotransporter
VIGVAVTGYILDAAGGAGSIGGWWQAHSLAAVMLVIAMFVFNAFAKGTKLFD